MNVPKIAITLRRNYNRYRGDPINVLCAAGLWRAARTLFSSGRNFCKDPVTSLCSTPESSTRSSLSLCFCKQNRTNRDVPCAVGVHEDTCMQGKSLKKLLFSSLKEEPALWWDKLVVYFQPRSKWLRSAGYSTDRQSVWICFCSCSTCVRVVWCSYWSRHKKPVGIFCRSGQVRWGCLTGLVLGLHVSFSLSSSDYFDEISQNTFVWADDSFLVSDLHKCQGSCPNNLAARTQPHQEP